MSKKFLAKLLIFCMVFTMLPMSAFAATGEDVAVGDVTYRVALDTKAVTVEANASTKLNATVYQVNGDTESTINVSDDLVWTSSDETIATVRNGLVTGVKAGTANITASYKGAEATCAVTVTTAHFAGTSYSVTINEANNVFALTGNNRTANLTAVLKVNDTIKEISEVKDGAKLTWTVEPEKDVVTLSPNGRRCTVTANEVKEKTEAVITATLTAPKMQEVKDKDGKVTMEVVKDDKGNPVMEVLAAASYTIYNDPVVYTIAMKENTTVALLVNGTAAEATKALETVIKADDKAVETGFIVGWTSSNEEVATVDQTGKVTAVGYGTAVITATLEGLNISATRTVNVAYKPVKVTFNADVEGVEKVEMTTNNQGKLANLPAEPTKEGYKFMGWAPEGQTVPVTINKIYLQAVELQAIWIEIEPLKADVSKDPVTGTLVATITGTYNGANTETEGGADVKGKKVTFDATVKDETVKEMVVLIDSTTAATFKDEDVTVDVVTNVATITLNGAALQDLAKKGLQVGQEQYIVLTATKLDNNLADPQFADKIKAAYDFTLQYHGQDVIKSANANITVTFKAPEGITDKVYAYFVNIDKAYALEPVANAKVSNGVITMTTSHFSQYVVSADKLVYTITFKPGEATGTEYVQNVQIPAPDKNGKVPAAKVRLMNNQFTKDNATFACWTPGNYENGQEIEITGDTTLTAVWKNNTTGDIIDSNPGGGGGGSSSNVSIASKVEGGKVTVTPTRPTRGQTVTINVTANEGYKLDTLVVTDNKGNNVELTKVSDNKYTFVMPAGKVTVTPTFVKIDAKEETKDPSAVKRFSDVASGAWYAEYITYVTENALMNGYDDGRFGPNDQTTRAQIVTVLYRLEGEPATRSSNSFSDVSSGGQYYSSAVAWAAINDIVNGYEDGRFGPNDNVTREQIATILYRYATYKGYDTENTGSIANFSDAAKVSSWANTAISWAVGEELMNGDNGALRPQGNATRAEIAALLMRFCENIAK